MNAREEGRARRPASEFGQKVIDIRRVTRVVKGGRRFSFLVVAAIGDRAGRVGLGLGKAADVSAAMEKATRAAQKRLFKVPLTADRSLPAVTQVKCGATKLLLRPRRPGRGLSAGGPVRAILDLAGVRHASAKILGRSKNRLNNARAVMAALASLRDHANA